MHGTILYPPNHQRDNTGSEMCERKNRRSTLDGIAWGCMKASHVHVDPMLTDPRVACIVRSGPSYTASNPGWVGLETVLIWDLILIGF